MLKNLNKILLGLIFSFCMYYIPLAVSGELFLKWNDYRILISSAFSLLIFFTQPEIKISQINSDAKWDAHSTLLILITSFFSQFFATLEGISSFQEIVNLGISEICGFGLVCIGYTIRLTSIAVLSKNFTATIGEIRIDNLVTTGIYSKVRHPSYLGAYLMMIGINLFFLAYISLGFSAVILFLVYAYRIKVEELMLQKHYGDAFTEYCQRTKWKIIPYLY